MLSSSTRGHEGKQVTIMLGVRVKQISLAVSVLKVTSSFTRGECKGSLRREMLLIKVISVSDVFEATG